ncbi:hypothetical protein [Simkania sp.]|uniref:hypothetical protein n=1 Tax=Simkania sp. TaxID=34094 RepID=UPI003B520D28
MSLYFRLTQTVYDGTTSNLISNLLLRPTQSLFDQRTYFFYTKENGDDFSHICFDEVTSKVMHYFNLFIGVIHSCYCIFNLAGFAMKVFSYLTQPSVAYFLAESAISESFVKKTTQWPMINTSAISRCPPQIDPTDEELEAIKTIKTTDLIDIWNKVSNHSQRDKIAQDLHDWLTLIVPYPDKYTYIAKEVAPEAAATLEQKLKLIIHQIRENPELSDDVIERHILSIVDKAYLSKQEQLSHAPHSDDPLENLVACSPTWIEVTEQVYKELKGGETVETRLLLYLQQIKEDIIHELSEEMQRDGTLPNIEWHGLNMGRIVIGKEIGLDRSNLKYDSTFKLPGSVQIILKYPVLYRFFQRCPPQELKERLIKKISYEHQGKKTKGLDPELMTFIEPYAKAYFKDNKIDYEDDDLPTSEWGIAPHIMKYFHHYDPKEDKYHFNDLGAKVLLTLIGVPV